MGLFFSNEATANQERRDSERRAKEDFSQNHPFAPFLTPTYGIYLFGRTDSHLFAGKGVGRHSEESRTVKAHRQTKCGAVNQL